MGGSRIILGLALHAAQVGVRLAQEELATALATAPPPTAYDPRPRPRTPRAGLLLLLRAPRHMLFSSHSLGESAVVVATVPLQSVLSNGWW